MPAFFAVWRVGADGGDLRRAREFDLGRASDVTKKFVLSLLDFCFRCFFFFLCVLLVVVGLSYFLIFFFSTTFDMYTFLLFVRSFSCGSHLVDLPFLLPSKLVCRDARCVWFSVELLRWTVCF